MRDRIEFLVIGAQKSGTTSLFRYLEAHPAIYMPGKKEVAFFARDQLYNQGTDTYLREFFAAATSEQIAGEASPQYMCYEKCPVRIAEAFPKIKLIAVLRNPIARAYSHYRMARRREVESRSFEECIEQQIRRGRRTDEDVNEQTDYVALGEYGRILTRYLDFFEREQISIAWSEQLDADTHRVMNGLYRFLGVDESFVSPEFSRRFHKSGNRRFRGWADRTIRSLLKRSERVIGIRRAQVIRFWYETEWNVKPKDMTTASTEAVEALRDHYADDLQTLAEAFDVAVPWREWSEETPTPEGSSSLSAEPGLCKMDG